MQKLIESMAGDKLQALLIEQQTLLDSQEQIIVKSDTLIHNFETQARLASQLITMKSNLIKKYLKQLIFLKALCCVLIIALLIIIFY